MSEKHTSSRTVAEITPIELAPETEDSKSGWEELMEHAETNREKAGEDLGSTAVESTIVEPAVLETATQSPFEDYRVHATGSEKLSVTKENGQFLKAEERSEVEQKAIEHLFTILSEASGVALKNSVEVSDDVAGLLEGRITDFGARIDDMRRLRQERKGAISAQRSEVDEALGKASSARIDALDARLATFLRHNAVARAVYRRTERNKMKEAGFKKIEDSGRKGLRRRLDRMQVRQNARKDAKNLVADRSSEALKTAEKTHLSAKEQLQAQKAKRRQLRYIPLRRRTTLEEGTSAGFYETWKDAKKKPKSS